MQHVLGTLARGRGGDLIIAKAKLSDNQIYECIKLMLGKTLSSRYHIIKHLGGGGFGQTYLAEDRQLPGNPLCVVKQLKPKATDSESLEVAKQLFDREAQVLYNLGNHDQIPRLLAHFEQDEEFYLVQEFIEGHELKQELPTGRHLSETQVIAILQDILKTLEFVHQQDVIHRDIKPSNLIRRKQDSKIVIIDFGAVKQLSTQAIASEEQTSLTVSIGSPGYMPNEQISGKPQFCSDIYAVGMIGIQALTGWPPSKLPDDPKTSEKIWRDRLPVGAIHELALLDILDKMVRFDYRQRYQTATEALQALSSLDNSPASIQYYQVFTSKLTQLTTPTQSVVTPTLTLENASSGQQIFQDMPSESLLGQVASQKQNSSVYTFKNKYRQLIIIAAGITTALTLSAGIHQFQKPKSLWEQAENISLANTLPGHANGVQSIALGADGQTLASGGMENTIKIRNLRTKELIHTLTGHSGNVYSIAISPDGNTLVSGSADKTIKVWNLQTGEVLRTIEGHSAPVHSVAISPDGNTLVSGSADKTIKIWNLRTGQLIRNLVGTTGELAVSAVAFSPDGQMFASDDSYNVKVWDMVTGELLRTLEGHKSPVTSIAFSSDSQTLVSGSLDGTAKLWYLKTGQLLNTFLHRSQTPNGEPSEGVHSVAISPDGQTLVTGSGLEQNTIKLWNVRTGTEVSTLKGHTDTVFSLAFSPDGQTLYSGSLDGTIQVWQVR